MHPVTRSYPLDAVCHEGPRPGPQDVCLGWQGSWVHCVTQILQNVTHSVKVLQKNMTYTIINKHSYTDIHTDIGYIHIQLHIYRNIHTDRHIYIYMHYIYICIYIYIYM